MEQPSFEALSDQRPEQVSQGCNLLGTQSQTRYCGNAGEEIPQDGSLRSGSERKEISVLGSNLASVLSFELATRPVAGVSVKMQGYP